MFSLKFLSMESHAILFLQGNASTILRFGNANLFKPYYADVRCRNARITAPFTENFQAKYENNTGNFWFSGVHSDDMWRHSPVEHQIPTRSQYGFLHGSSIRSQSYTTNRMEEQVRWALCLFEIFTQVSPLQASRATRLWDLQIPPSSRSLSSIIVCSL